MRKASLAIIVKENRILLAMKKRGFGKGRWNGAGGKFDPEKGDKAILDTAIRETEEEIGIKPKNLEELGVLSFYFPHKKEWDQDVHVFMIKEWEGEFKETEEMLPCWFDIDKIPFDEMWKDDRYWLLPVLRGKKIKKARFVFTENDDIKDYDIEFN